MNKLYYGDCLDIMQEMKSESVDLIYLDPPFNSNRAYHNIYKDETGRPLPDQVEAFWDMWTLDEAREEAIKVLPLKMRNAGIDDKTAEFWRIWMDALREHQPSLLAYLSYMIERLIPMKRLLKSTGSIYLHCDPTASHYIKIMMDTIFGHENFRNEIVWHYTNRLMQARNRFAKMHDYLLLYSKSSSFTYNPQYDKNWQPSNTQKRRLSAGWEIRKGVLIVYDDEKFQKVDTEKLQYDSIQYSSASQPPVGSVWNLPILNPMAKERRDVGYATQKPLALLDRIIKASSNPKELVFDPFCGCATTLEAAHKLNRHWIGIDIAIHAVKRVARIRLQKRLKLKDGQHFVIDGIPRDKEGARDLWKRNPYQFQKWAVEEVEGFVTNKQSADGGIDGRLYFALPNVKSLQSMVIEVKGGQNVKVNDLRALKGVLNRDPAELAGLIIMDPLGEIKERNFRTEMASAGFLEVGGKNYPRVQMLTVDDILAGTRFQTPTVFGRGLDQQPTLD